MKSFQFQDQLFQIPLNMAEKEEHFATFKVDKNQAQPNETGHNPPQINYLQRQEITSGSLNDGQTYKQETRVQSIDLIQPATAYNVFQQQSLGSRPESQQTASEMDVNNTPFWTKHSAERAASNVIGNYNGSTNSSAQKPSPHSSKQYDQRSTLGIKQQNHQIWIHSNQQPRGQNQESGTSLIQKKDTVESVQAKKKPTENDKRLLGNTPGIGPLKKDPSTGLSLAPLPTEKFKLRYEQNQSESDRSSARQTVNLDQNPRPNGDPSRPKQLNEYIEQSPLKSAYSDMTIATNINRGGKHDPNIIATIESNQMATDSNIQLPQSAAPVAQYVFKTPHQTKSKLPQQDNAVALSTYIERGSFGGGLGFPRDEQIKSQKVLQSLTQEQTSLQEYVNQQGIVDPNVTERRFTAHFRNATEEQSEVANTEAFRQPGQNSDREPSSVHERTIPNQTPPKAEYGIFTADHLTETEQLVTEKGVLEEWNVLQSEQGSKVVVFDDVESTLAAQVALPASQSSQANATPPKEPYSPEFPSPNQNALNGQNAVDALNAQSEESVTVIKPTLESAQKSEQSSIPLGKQESQQPEAQEDKESRNEHLQPSSKAPSGAHSHPQCEDSHNQDASKSSQTDKQTSSDREPEHKSSQSEQREKSANHSLPSQPSQTDQQDASERHSQTDEKASRLNSDQRIERNNDGILSYSIISAEKSEAELKGGDLEQLDISSVQPPNQNQRYVQDTKSMQFIVSQRQEGDLSSAKDSFMKRSQECYRKNAEQRSRTGTPEGSAAYSQQKQELSREKSDVSMKQAIAMINIPSQISEKESDQQDGQSPQLSAESGHKSINQQSKYETENEEDARPHTDSHNQTNEEEQRQQDRSNGDYMEGKTSSGNDKECTPVVGQSPIIDPDRSFGSQKPRHHHSMDVAARPPHAGPSNLVGQHRLQSLPGGQGPTASQPNLSVQETEQTRMQPEHARTSAASHFLQESTVIDTVQANDECQSMKIHHETPGKGHNQRQYRPLRDADGQDNAKQEESSSEGAGGGSEEAFLETRDALDAVVHRSQENLGRSPPHKSYDSPGRSQSQDNSRMRDSNTSNHEDGHLRERKASRVSFKEGSEDEQTPQCGGSRSELVREEKSDENTVMSKFTSQKGKTTKAQRKRRRTRSSSPKHSRGQSSPSQKAKGGSPERLGFVIEKGRLVYAPRREAVDFDNFQFPIRRSQYDMKTVGKMILSKKKLKSSLNEVKRQINRRANYNRDLLANRARGKQLQPDYTEAAVGTSGALPTVQGWSAGSSTSQGRGHPTNAAAQYGIADAVAGIGVQDQQEYNIQENDTTGGEELAHADKEGPPPEEEGEPKLQDRDQALVSIDIRKQSFSQHRLDVVDSESDLANPGTGTMQFARTHNNGGFGVGSGQQVSQDDFVGNSSNSRPVISQQLAPLRAPLSPKPTSHYMYQNSKQLLVDPNLMPGAVLNTNRSQNGPLTLSELKHAFSGVNVGHGSQGPPFFHPGNINNSATQGGRALRGNLASSKKIIPAGSLVSQQSIYKIYKNSNTRTLINQLGGKPARLESGQPPETENTANESYTHGKPAGDGYTAELPQRHHAGNIKVSDSHSNVYCHLSAPTCQENLTPRDSQNRQPLPQRSHKNLYEKAGAVESEEQPKRRKTYSSLGFNRKRGNAGHKGMSESKVSQSINAIPVPQWKVTDKFMKWLSKGTSATLTQQANPNLVSIKSGNALFKGDHQTASFSNPPAAFYENPAMTQSTDVALATGSTRYRDTSRRQKNLREFSNPAAWDNHEDSAGEIIINKPAKPNPLTAVNQRVHLVQQLRTHKQETLEERRLRLKDYAMKKEAGYSMVTTGSTNQNLVNYLQKQYTYDNLAEMGGKAAQTVHGCKTTPLVIVRNHRRSIPKLHNGKDGRRHPQQETQQVKTRSEFLSDNYLQANTRQLLAIRRNHYLYDDSPAMNDLRQPGMDSSAKRTQTQFIRRKAQTKIGSPRIVTAVQNRQKKPGAHRVDSLARGVLLKKQANTRSQENRKGRGYRQTEKAAQASARQINLTMSQYQGASSRVPQLDPQTVYSDSGQNEVNVVGLDNPPIRTQITTSHEAQFSDHVEEQEIVETEGDQAQHELPQVRAESDLPHNPNSEADEIVGEQTIIDEGTPTGAQRQAEVRKQQEIIDRARSSGIQLMAYGEESEEEEDYYADDQFVYEDADADEASSQDPETKFIKELIENEKNNQGQQQKRVTDRSAKLGQRSHRNKDGRVTDRDREIFSSDSGGQQSEQQKKENAISPVRLVTENDIDQKIVENEYSEYSDDQEF